MRTSHDVGFKTWQAKNYTLLQHAVSAARSSSSCYRRNRLRQVPHLRHSGWRHGLLAVKSETFCSLRQTTRHAESVGQLTVRASARRSKPDDWNRPLAVEHVTASTRQEAWREAWQPYWRGFMLETDQQWRLSTSLCHANVCLCEYVCALEREQL